MRPEEDEIHAQRGCGRFFGSLVALSAGLACICLYHGEWEDALKLVPGMLFFSGLAWWAFSSSVVGPDPEHGPGKSGAGKPVPVGPKPTHHLIAAKELPPSDKTHSFPHD